MDNYQNNPGVPPINPDQTQTAGQPYGNPYGQQQSYQQYQQQGYPNFTGQGGAGGTLYVTDYARQHLRSIAGWTKFLSIVMLISIVLFIGLFLYFIINPSDMLSGSSYSGGYGYGYEYSRSMTETVLRAVFIFYVVVMAIFLLPTIWALSSAAKMKKAALYGDAQDLEDGLRKWKYVCVFFGVLTIIYLAFLALAIIGAAFAGGM
ncbi:MAG: hypothetical protein IKX36_07460 [Prevotella sp.]|nr:hypothetical protein [Prevotella sp.]